MYTALWPSADQDEIRSHSLLSPTKCFEKEIGLVCGDQVRTHQTSSLFDRTPQVGRFTCGDNVPVIEMARDVLSQIMFTIGNRPPETGGVLIGPVGKPLKVTDYFFDEGASCTTATYSPDTVTINRLRNEEWLPAGLDWNGFIHSHPNGFDRPSVSSKLNCRV